MKRVSGGAVKEDTIEIQGDHREKVAERGYMRQCGRPWAWTDPKNGKRRRADNRLHGIFHNPFYAGWVVSDRFGIPYGEVRSRISQLRQEEARLGRLLVTGKLSEAAYDQLREEWSEKIQNAERILADVERETTLYFDDLDAALAVLTNIKNLYNGSHKLGGSANGRLREPGTEELPGSPVERFYASLRFEKREKLDELLQEKGDNSPI